MKKILLAGATGYLGNYIAQELVKRGINTRLIVRNPGKLPSNLTQNENIEIVEAEVTHPTSISDCCEGMDAVISTVGITRQKDGLRYMDVDYQANLNLLREAVKSGVKKFIYVSVLNGEKLTHIAICRAKERFVDALTKIGIDYCIVRPNGFFSDMSEFYDMARKGKIYLFGDGRFRTNPIHGEDLARACVDMLESDQKVLEIGGPETLTHNEIAQIAFEVAGNKPKISRMPDWIRKLTLSLAKTFWSKQKFGPMEFFMTVMAMDMVAPEYGEHTLREWFRELDKANK